MRRCKKYLALLLSVVCLMAMGLTAFAAEPTAPANQVPTETRSGDDGDYGIMPASIYGYAAKYTNPLTGSFTVDAPGSTSSSGTFQITTHDFPNSPTITAVLYRPDGSYACQIYITGNGTKTKTFSNAVPGTYEVVYAVEGSYGGWISAWVSS